VLKPDFAAVAGSQRSCSKIGFSHEWTDALLPLRGGALHLHHLDARSLGARPHHLPCQPLMPTRRAAPPPNETSPAPFGGVPAGAHLRITDTTLRDGNQSLFRSALTNDELATLAGRFDGLGFAALEAFGGDTYEAALARGEDPWDALARMAAATPRTPLQSLIRGQYLVAGRSLPDDAVRLWIQTAADLGVDIFRIFDALNDLRNLEVPVAAAKAAEKRVQGALAYTVSPVHDLALWRELARGMRDLGVDDVVIKDTGGLLTPQMASELVPALAEATGLPVIVHSHCSGGLAPFTYLAAIQAGAAGVDTAFAAFGGGAGQPGVEALVAILPESGRDTGLNLNELVALRDELEEVRSRHLEDLIPFADRADPLLLQYALPRSMLQDIVGMLEEHGARAHFEEVLAEVARVREDLGWAPLLAPVRQLVAAQAVYNVLGSTRYETVTQELKDYLQGLYGAPPKPVNPHVRTQVLGQTDPITVRPADLLNPVVEATRDALLKEAQAADDTEATGSTALPATDGDVLHAILFPEPAAQVRGSRRTLADLVARQEEEAREEELGAGEEAGPPADSPAAASVAPPAPQAAELQVEVEGEVFTVRVTGAGFAITPGAAPAAATPAPGGAAPAAAPAPHNAVVAPMQGLIVKIPVEVGTEVQMGDVVAVLEAMKMQNDIVANRAGTVTHILVNEQDVVTPEQPLIAIG
jgi:pyruvate carboxylase subunit B